MNDILHFIYTHVPPWVPIAVISHLTILGAVAYLILLERKIASWTQDRIGPNRVGLDFGILPFKFLKKVNGLGQPLADGLKFILKEDYKPKGVDVILFTLAPAVMIIVIIISIACIPWGGTLWTTRDVEVTGTTESSGLAAVQANIPMSAVVASAWDAPDGGETKKQRSAFDIVTDKPTADYKAPGTKVYVTYDLANAAGQVRTYTRVVDIGGYTEASETAAVLARLPAGASLVGADPVRGKQPVTVDVPIEIVKGSDGVFREYARNVSYYWYFAPGRLNIGVLYVLAVLSLAVYGVVVGGWASNNKYSFLGGLRATANMISYEIPLGLVVLCVVLLHGTLDMHNIVDAQAGYWLGVIPAWNMFTQPLAFVLFVVCIHAEANRAPFDTAEAEQELVGGYHTEYSAMRFALFFLAEYAGMITTSAVCVALFMGGWHLPYIDYLWPALAGKVDGVHPSATDSLIACVVRAGVFFGKTIGIIFLFMWVRWSLPRFRFDQIMMLAWRALIPISLALLMATAVTVYLVTGGVNTKLPLQLPFGTAIALFVANVVVLAAAMIISKLLPPAPETNRRMKVPGSRFVDTPLPGKPVAGSGAAAVSAN
jgi:NADH:ubiquinone oxidoreductase subunit H